MHQAKQLIVDSSAAAETVKISAGTRDKSVPNDLEQRIELSRIKSTKVKIELLFEL